MLHFIRHSCTYEWNAFRGSGTHPLHVFPECLTVAGSKDLKLHVWIWSLCPEVHQSRQATDPPLTEGKRKSLMETEDFIISGFVCGFIKEKHTHCGRWFRVLPAANSAAGFLASSREIVLSGCNRKTPENQFFSNVPPRLHRGAERWPASAAERNVNFWTCCPQHMKLNQQLFIPFYLQCIKNSFISLRQKETLKLRWGRSIEIIYK